MADNGNELVVAGTGRGGQVRKGGLMGQRAEPRGGLSKNERLDSSLPQQFGRKEPRNGAQAQMANQSPNALDAEALEALANRMMNGDKIGPLETSPLAQEIVRLAIQNTSIEEGNKKPNAARVNERIKESLERINASKDAGSTQADAMRAEIERELIERTILTNNGQEKVLLKYDVKSSQQSQAADKMQEYQDQKQKFNTLSDEMLEALGPKGRAKAFMALVDNIDDPKFNELKQASDRATTPDDRQKAIDQFNQPTTTTPPAPAAKTFKLSALADPNDFVKLASSNDPAPYMGGTKMIAPKSAAKTDTDFASKLNPDRTV